MGSGFKNSFTFTFSNKLQKRQMQTLPPHLLQVVQKQMLGEVGTRMVIQWPAVSGIFVLYQKLLKSVNPSSYNQ